MTIHIKIVLFSLLGLLTTTQSHAQNFDKYKQTSLYTDFKAKQIGDIVTIMIVESTSGSQQSDASRNNKGSLSAKGKMGGNLTRFLPLFNASTNFEDKNSGAADAAQKDALNGKLTAIVSDVSPNGNLTLTGKRHLEVNGDTYLLTVEGIARQKDITAENMVLSYNLANVEISYTKDGFMDGVASPFVRRWTTWFLMAGVATSAYYFLGVASD